MEEHLHIGDGTDSHNPCNKSKRTAKKAADKKQEIEGREMLVAVSSNNSIEVQRLITKKCSVNEPDYDGRTPLHIAASNNNLEIV